MNGDKRCPYCRGEVPGNAIKCRHCGEFIDAPPRQPGPDGPPAYPGAQTAGPPSNGIATAALVIGIITILFGCLAPVALVLGIIGLSNAKKHPARPGYGSAMAGLIIGAFFTVIIIIGIIAAIAIPSFLGFNVIANETRAQATLHVIISAEELHRSQFGNYATLEQLALKNLISGELARSTSPVSAKGGYYYELSANYSTWSCKAIPSSPGSTGRHSYFVDQTGTIRQKSMTKSFDSPADANSPVLRR